MMDENDVDTSKRLATDSEKDTAQVDRQTTDNDRDTALVDRQASIAVRSTSSGQSVYYEAHQDTN